MIQLIKYEKVTTFYSEHLTEFDIACEVMIAYFKMKYRYLKLCVVMHYTTAMNPQKLPLHFDKVIIPKIKDENSLKAIKYFMVNRSNYMIAYVEDKNNDLYRMMKYARKIGIYIFKCNI